MIRTHSAIRVAAALLLAGACTLGLDAQSTTTTPAASPPAKPAIPDKAVGGGELDTIQLTPFEVVSGTDKGYGAINSNSITAFNAELSHLPVSADIFDQKFMDDVGATSVEQLLQTYSAGAGSSNSNPGSSASNSQPLDRNGNSFLSLRGVTAPTMQRDGLMPLNTFFNSGSTGTGITSNFDVEEVDQVKGPQALLYGVGGAGGVINLVSKQARLRQPAFGKLQFQVDQYGHKLGLLDYGMGTDRVAVRIAITDQTYGNRRLDVGGPMTGLYAQIAAHWGNTTFRLMGDQTVLNRQVSSSPSLTATSTAADARNGLSLRYLLYTNQIQAAANGAPSGSGVIANGALNWNNIDSLAGWYDGEYTKDTFETLTAESRWSSWLSTQVAVGYRKEYDQTIGGGPSLIAPNVTTNPYYNPTSLTNTTWAVSGSAGGLYEPLREKAIRASAVAVNDLFGGRAKSKTVFGADFTRADGAVITVGYVKSDANFNPSPSGATSNNGYTNITPIIWALPADGPLRNPYWTPRSTHVTYQGQNYTLVIPNDTVSSLISPSNPLGLSGTGSGDYRIGKAINRGIYAANYTDWLDGRLSTLFGFRSGKTFEVNQLEASSPQPPSTTLMAAASTTSFNAGVNYALTNWLRPYITASNSYDAPAVLSADPYGGAPKVANAVGEEAGFKIAPAGARISGAIAVYHANSKNEQYSFTSTLTNDINPAGLNGRFGAVSNFVNLDRATTGEEITLTATPNDSWRMRLSAATVRGTISTSATYPQFYNDQFYENSQGQVTYKDGTVVYVSSTATKATISTAGAAGAVPFTVALMNTVGGVYYANPAAITAGINSSSGAATILRTIDPVHGAILTGVSGLPISQLQIAPLASAPPPGSIVLAQPGDFTTGYPRYSFNYTTVYTQRWGMLKGLEIGGTVSASWKASSYYFYPNGTGSPNAARILYYQPMLSRFDGIFGYAHRFNRVTFRTQLNIANMFNHYHVILLPNAVTGYAGAYSVTFDQQPRVYTWSSTVSF